MKTIKEKQAWLKKNWDALKNYELARRMGVGVATVSRWGRLLGLHEKKGGPKALLPDQVDQFKDIMFQHVLKSKRRFSVEELANKYDVSPKRIREAIDQLKAENRNFDFTDSEIQVKDQVSRKPPTVIDASHLQGKRFKIGFVTDNHLGSNYERLDVLNAVYDRFQKEGITDVYNAGNVIDGEARFNKFDIHKHGMQAQCDYFAEIYPSRPGITTHYITGDDHEGWYVQREGINIGEFMQATAVRRNRTDLNYIGHMEHDIVFKTKKGRAVMRVVHPGGGSSYAFSYQPQKIVESYRPGEKPDILLIGHYHKSSYDYIRGVHVVQGGCTMDQSPFMRKKRLEAHVGGWMLEIQQGENGIIQSFQVEWMPFYGKDFYDKGDLWSYKYRT